MNKILFGLGLFSLIPLFSLSSSTPRDIAEKLHRESLVIDGHNDLPWRLREEKDLSLIKFNLNQNQPQFHTDFPRLRAGGMKAQFWSVYVPSETMESGDAYKMTVEQINLVHLMNKKYPDQLEFAGSTREIESAIANGKIASLIGMEGGHSIENSLDKLRDLYARGARYMTLTHWKNLDWVEAATDKPMSVGLTAFGEEVIHEMNRLGMFVDISHISAKAMHAVLAVTKAPVIASHSSAYALKNHVRNVPDDVLKLVAHNGGVVMVNFYPAFISNDEMLMPDNFIAHVHPCEAPELKLWMDRGRLPKATVDTVVNHIEHIANVAGVDHVGLGSDFDGVPTLPIGLEDVSKYPAITTELVRRGHSEADIKKILGENLMRAFKRMESVRGR